jgi:iron complex transport system substrate-binding protein
VKPRTLGLVNFGAILLALGLALIAFAGEQHGKQRATAPLQTSSERDLQWGPLPGGGQGVLDSSGYAIPAGGYQRVASATIVADALLLEFASPNQIAAFTHYSKDNTLFAYRYDGRPQIDALHDMERLLALQPDLLLVSSLAAGPRLERLRESGLALFVTGEMRGVDNYLHNARAVATLLGRAQAGELYVRTFRRRLESIARNLPAAARKTALQLVYYGKQIFGSGRHTSYFDVLTYAGLIDLGAQHFEGWPSLSMDQVLAIDPQVLITRDGMGAALCAQPTLSALKACQPSNGQIVELPDALLNDPGAMMLPSAELIHSAVYGTEPPAPNP